MQSDKNKIKIKTKLTLDEREKLEKLELS